MFTRKLFIRLLIVSVVIVVATDTLPAIGFVSRTNPDDIQAVTASLDDEIQISPPASPDLDRYKPAVAYNWVHDEYLVVWHNNRSDGYRDIYARRVSENGELLSWFSVSAGPNDRVQPAVTYNAATDEYLVVWMYNVSGDGSTYEIWGRTIAWNGAYQDPEFQIITWPNRTFWTPKVVWNSYRNEYFVVWNAFDATTSLPTDVAHAILDSDGNKLYGALISTVDAPHQIDVTYNIAADEYLAVWRSMKSAADGDIMAARVGAGTGQVVTPPGIIMINNSTNEDSRQPIVVTNQQEFYLVAWTHDLPPYSNSSIGVQLLDVNADWLNGFYLVHTADDLTSPALAFQPGGGINDYLLIYQQSSPNGENINTYSPIYYIGEIAAATFWDHESPAVAWGSLER